MNFYGYDEARYNNQFLEAMRTAEQAFLRDTQSFSVKRDLTDNQVLSDEYKKAYIEMPNTKYDGGVIFSFMEETKKQGRDNVLFSPLLTAEENRAAFDSMRDDFKEKLKREFDKRKISYDDNLLNALSSRDSHKITMAIAQNGLKERDLSVLLNNNHSAAPKVSAPAVNSSVSPEQVKKMTDFMNTQLEGTTPDNLKEKYVDGHEGEVQSVAFDRIAGKKREDSLNKLNDVAVNTKHGNPVAAESLNIDLEGHKRELVNYLDHMDRTMNYYSMSAQGGRPRNDCSTLVGNSLAVEFGRGDYPKESWAALQGMIGPDGSRRNSELMIKSLASVAGDMIVGKNMHSMSNDQERKNILLNMIKEVGHGGVIATDQGQTSFDQDRAWGVDHIVRVVEKNGQLYVYETESPNGTHATPAEEWAEKKSHIRDTGKNAGLAKVENFYAVRGKDLRDGMASGEFVKDTKLRNYTLTSIKEGFIDDIKIFAANNNIDPRVAAAYLKYNDSYEKFAEAVKNIDDNPAATWKKMQEHAEQQAKGMGLEYHFDKNDGLIAKIFAALGMMLTQGMKDQENNVGVAKTQEMENKPQTSGVAEKSSNNVPTTTQQTERKIAGYKHIIYDNGEVEKVPIYRDQLDEPGKYVYNTLDNMKGETESGHNITSTTIGGNGIDKHTLANIQSNTQPNPEIKNSPTTTHESTLTF